MALVKMRDCKDRLGFQEEICEWDTVFVSAGTWHNVINIGRMPLKVSVQFSPDARLSSYDPETVRQIFEGIHKTTHI